MDRLSGAGGGRYALLGGACALATLVNPYGWRLHQHVAAYLRSDWIRSVVDEFQSPRFRSESMLQFEILLFVGVALVAVLLPRRRFSEALLILFWAHAALASARHVPLYTIAAAPVCATEASRLWSLGTAGFSRKSVVGTLRDCLRDFSAIPQRWSIWALVSLVCLAGAPWQGPQDFPGNKFPVAAFERNRAVLEPAAGRRPRILTSDQWADYLIYRLYPGVKVFVDGRSDFYGHEVGREYLDLLNGAGDWERIVERYGFDAALLPAEWPLGQLLQRDARWRVLYRDPQAILLERKSETRLNPKPASAERILGDAPSEFEGTSAPKIRDASRTAEVHLPL